LTPQNSSSDEESDPQQAEAAGSLRALIGRLAEELNTDTKTIAAVAAIFEEVKEHAPDLFVPAAGGLATAFAQAVASSGDDIEPVFQALGEWALDAEGEPIEHMRRDCLRFQAAMTRGVLRLHGGNSDRCAESLLALQRFIFLQIAVLAALAARSQEAGGVVRTLPTPEYATFMDIFRTTIETHRQEGTELGLLLLHVAKIEQVDSLLGLQRGEAFMLRVTRRMREGVLRKQDQLGRVSRDQLACLLPRIAGEGVAILAANKILGALEAPIPIGDRSFPPDAVIGIAMFPAHGADPQTLVRNGKLAVRAARETVERYAVYDPAQGVSEERNMLYEARLRHAIEENTLELVFQPQLSLGTGRIAGLECKLRWTDAELGEVSEARAVEAAFSAGLTKELTWWLFNSALRLSGEFSNAGIAVPIGLKVTASGLQPDFPEFVGRALRTWKVPAEQLVIEIHEAALIGEMDQVQDILERLKKLGLRLAIDGFGTGSSSLSNLAKLPLDEVRISATFVSDMRQVVAHAKIVRSLAHLAQDLGLRITAEGVDDADTALALSTLGCDRIQGGHVGPALSAQDVLAANLFRSGSDPVPQ
jgi:diguanylate cyclase